MADRHFRSCALILLVLLSACSKEEKAVEKETHTPCPELKAPLITSNSPVFSTDTLFLFAQSDVADATYEWKGPAGFQSTLANPFIHPALYYHSGKYFCRIGYAGCNSLYSMTTVQVKAPCPELDFNTAVVDSVLWYFFSGVSCGPTGSQGFFGITASNNQGTLEVIFGNRYARPYGYHIFPVSALPQADSSTVQLRLIEGGTAYVASEGQLYVHVEWQQVSVTFCTMIFHSQLSTQRKIDARIGCQ
jgi:hypothetical protein